MPVITTRRFRLVPLEARADALAWVLAGALELRESARRLA
jgi:hypothetical protein